MQSLVELAFIGEPLEFDLMSARAYYAAYENTGRGSRKIMLLLLFVGFYVFYIVMVRTPPRTRGRPSAGARSDGRGESMRGAASASCCCSTCSSR